MRPVMASPHSPLQQRPQTAGASPRAPPFRSSSGGESSTFQPGHVRNAPSRMGGASMLSNVTNATNDGDTSTIGAGSKRVKKKRSAFGWLKKAFSLDEDERQAFEAQKLSQHQNLYYDERSARYLDGKRIR